MNVEIQRHLRSLRLRKSADEVRAIVEQFEKFGTKYSVYRKGFGHLASKGTANKLWDLWNAGSLRLLFEEKGRFKTVPMSELLGNLEVGKDGHWHYPRLHDGDELVEARPLGDMFHIGSVTSEAIFASSFEGPALFDVVLKVKRKDR